LGPFKRVEGTYNRKGTLTDRDTDIVSVSDANGLGSVERWVRWQSPLVSFNLSRVALEDVVIKKVN